MIKLKKPPSFMG